jgi:hypothetical protein
MMTGKRVRERGISRSLCRHLLPKVDRPPWHQLTRGVFSPNTQRGGVGGASGGGASGGATGGSGGSDPDPRSISKSSAAHRVPAVKSTALCQALSKTIARTDGATASGPYAQYWPALVGSVEALGGLSRDVANQVRKADILSLSPHPSTPKPLCVCACGAPKPVALPRMTPWLAIVPWNYVQLADGVTTAPAASEASAKPVITAVPPTSSPDRAADKGG